VIDPVKAKVLGFMVMAVEGIVPDIVIAEPGVGVRVKVKLTDIPALPFTPVTETV
jgi:hypothetical protein